MLSPRTRYLEGSPYPSTEIQMMALRWCVSGHGAADDIPWASLSSKQLQQYRVWKKSPLWDANRGLFLDALLDLRFEKDKRFAEACRQAYQNGATVPEKGLAAFIKKRFDIQDLDILNYKIGQPISQKEAYRHFIRDRVDVSKAPAVQKDSIQNGRLLDFITMEEVLLSECVQLCQDGYILTRESFRELVEKNTQRWQGRENVGFQSPETGTLYGNLVLYNYNDEYHPQKDGILTISTVPNTSRILYKKGMPPPERWFVSSYTHKNGVPYTWRLNGQPVSFYVPDNEEGRLILMLYIDAFKKGNLFGFSSYGNTVRLGRVHVKISLHGYSHNFPDQTFDMRTAGELSKNGVSPDTLLRNHNTGRFVPRDPYPDEKRWVVSWR